MSLFLKTAGSGRVSSGSGIRPKYCAGLGKTPELLTGTGVCALLVERDAPLQALCAYSNSFKSSNAGTFFWSWILKRLDQSLGKEKESRCIVLSSWTKCEIRQFHVAVVQRRQRNVQKSVMQVQSCCFANLNLRVLVCRSRCRRRRRCLSFLIVVKKEREGEIRDPFSRLERVERFDYDYINNVCSEFYSNGVFLGILIV